MANSNKVLISVRLRPSCLNKLQTLADSKEMTLSELIRHILEYNVTLY